MATKPARERRQHRSRRQILLAARELVLELGADAVSLRAVAARANYSPASLYEYFEGKDDLLRELGEESMVVLRGRMERVPATLPPDRRPVRYAQAYLSFA